MTFILDSRKRNIENKICKFNGKFLVQTNDNIMEIIFTPTYATLNMCYFEVTFYTNGID